MAGFILPLDFISFIPMLFLVLSTIPGKMLLSSKAKFSQHVLCYVDYSPGLTKRNRYEDQYWYQ